MHYGLLILFALSIILIFYVGLRIKERYEETDPMLLELKTTLQPVFPDLDNVILLRGKKSYTINKKRIHMCLKDENGNYYDKNMLTYVLLHELAHVRCDEIGHTEKFHHIFEQMLIVAANKGVYNPNIPTVKDYCEYAK
jgi:hypothetical protein